MTDYFDSPGCTFCMGDPCTCPPHQSSPIGVARATAESTSQPDKPDLFKELETVWHFPCGMCIHREDIEPDTCKGCRYFFN